MRRAARGRGDSPVRLTAAVDRGAAPPSGRSPYTRPMTAASTPEIEADRQELIALIKDEAVFHGDFTLSSGKKATYYVDMRKLTLDHRAAPAIGRIMLDLVREIDGVVAVGGLTLGADPIANAVMHESARATRRSTRSSYARSPKTTAAAGRSRGRMSRANASSSSKTPRPRVSPRSRRSRRSVAKAPSPSRSPSSWIARPARRQRSRPKACSGWPRSTWTIWVSPRSRRRCAGYSPYVAAHVRPGQRDDRADHDDACRAKSRVCSNSVMWASFRMLHPARSSQSALRGSRGGVPSQP